MLSRVMTPKEQALILGLALAIAVGAVSLFLHDRPALSQPSSAQPAEPGAVFNSPLDLNAATPEQIALLPGIGPKLAEAIVQARTAGHFQSVDDLARVPGIGPNRLEAMRPFIAVR